MRTALSGLLRCEDCGVESAHSGEVDDLRDVIKACVSMVCPACGGAQMSLVRFRFTRLRDEVLGADRAAAAGIG